MLLRNIMLFTVMGCASLSASLMQIEGFASGYVDNNDDPITPPTAFGDVFGLYTETGTGTTFTLLVDIDETATGTVSGQQTTYTGAILGYTFKNAASAVTPYEVNLSAGNIGALTGGSLDFWAITPSGSSSTSTDIGAYQLAPALNDPLGISFILTNPLIEPTSTIPSVEILANGFSQGSPNYSMRYRLGPDAPNFLQVNTTITSITAVPEPQHYALALGLALVGLAIVRRRERA